MHSHDIFLRFEARETFQIVGLQVTCHPSLLSILLPPLRRTFTDRLTTIPHRLRSEDIFTIHRRDGEEDTYCIGVAVSSTEDLPSDIVTFEVPAHTYAVFRHEGIPTDMALISPDIQRWLKEHVDHYRPLPIPQAFPLEIAPLPPDSGYSVIFIPIEQEIPALRGLDNIDWLQLKGCYHSAEAIPDLLRQLVSEYVEQRANAFALLENELIHQGSLYSASAAVAPFLSKLLHEPAAPDKQKLLELLTLFGQGYHIDDKPRRFPHWSFMDHEKLDIAYLEEYRQGERTHNAVREGVVNYLPFLSSNDPQLCLTTLGLLGCFKEERAIVVPHLFTIMETTTNERILAYTLSCLGALLTPEDEATGWLLPYLSMEQPEGIRLHAAIALCNAMKEQISEDMLERIQHAQIYPHALSQHTYDMYEHWDHAEWLKWQAKCFLALMSVTTPENRFIPEPFPFPAQIRTVIVSMPEMRGFDENALRYPQWFNQYYVEGAIMMLIRFCFPVEKILDQIGYHDLNARQQRLLGMLAEHAVFWPDQGPYSRMDTITTLFQKLDIPDEMRTSLPGFANSPQKGYEEALNTSEMVQMLRKLGLPATQKSLQTYVSPVF